MESSYIQSSWQAADARLEKKLRPSSLSDFVGQSKVLERLSITLEAAKKRSEALSHTLFYGPPGLGKTTLASIIAEEMGSKLITISAPSVEKPGDLAGVLTSLEEGDVVFIDEIHRLQKAVEEYLYPAMEDFSLDIMLDSGAQARSVQVSLKPFTLVGATTRLGLLSSPLRNRFTNHCRLDYYTTEQVRAIITRTATIFNVDIHQGAIEALALRARGTPRIANNVLKWVRDFAQIHHENIISDTCCTQALAMLNIDELGLDEMDIKFLSAIIQHHNGGPVGIATLAAALGEEAETLAEVHEPYLIMQGLLRRTMRGREVTELAYAHLKTPKPT